MSAAAMSTTMRREWHACKAIAMQAYYKRRGQGSNWLSKLLLALALLAPAVAGHYTGKWMVSFGIGLGSAFALIALLWWSLLVASVTQQNFPVAYYLVPAMRRRSVLLLAGTALLIVIALVMLFAMAGIAPSLTAAIATVVLASAVAIMLIRAVQYLFTMWFFGPTLFGWSLPQAMEHWIGQHHVLATLLVLLVYLVLATWQWRRRGAAMIAAEPDFRPRAAGIYGWLLRRDCAGRKVDALLLHASGPRGFASMFVPIVFALLLAAAIAQPFLGADSPWAGGTTWAVVAMTIIGQYVAARATGAAILSQRAGHALVRLTAGAPPTALFNQVLGRALLRDFGLFWCASSAGALLFFAASGMDGARLLNLAAVFVMNLMLAGLLLRNYALGHALTGTVKVLVAFYVLAAAAWGTFVMRGTLSASMGVTILLVAGLLATAMVLWRARTFARLPVAFPAGRMGK